MGTALITYKILPEGDIQDLEPLKEEIRRVIEGEEGKLNKTEEEPLAFGLKALNVTLSMDESKETNKLEESLKSITGISSLDVIDYRRAL